MGDEWWVGVGCGDCRSWFIWTFIVLRILQAVLHRECSSLNTRLTSLEHNFTLGRTSEL